MSHVGHDIPARGGILPRVSERWAPLSQGGSPLRGVSYCGNVRELLANLYDRGLAGQFELVGSYERGVVAFRRRSKDIAVHDPFSAFLVPSGDWGSAEIIADLLHSHAGTEMQSIPQYAIKWVRRCSFAPPEVKETFRHAYKGGLQWSHTVDFRNGVEIDHAVYSDLSEAYTSALLRRYMPKEWLWLNKAKFPTFALDDLDSLYRVSMTVPRWLKWGFPLSRHPPGTKFEGWVTGEELVSAGLSKDTVTIEGRYKPLNWYSHPGTKKLLSLPPPLRKRIGNVIYGLHAKKDVRTRGYLTEPKRNPGDRVHYDDTERLPIWWKNVKSKRPFSRVDHAVMVTSRIRSALHRAAISVGEVHSVYVDGIVADTEPFDGKKDWLWPHLITWKIEAWGPCKLFAPGYHEWAGKPLLSGRVIDEVGTS
jgi:hypothetical protein